MFVAARSMAQITHRPRAPTDTTAEPRIITGVLGDLLNIDWLSILGDPVRSRFRCVQPALNWRRAFQSMSTMIALIEIPQVCSSKFLTCEVGST